MSLSAWSQHFFTSTRGHIVLLLRRSAHTVDELAATLGLTDNAVRVHLATLERDGLVYQSGVRRKGSKPALCYALTAEAEQLFPKAYAPVLGLLLTVLSSSLPDEKVEEIIRSTGQHLATHYLRLPADTLCERLQNAAVVLNKLGGLVELEEREDGYVIQGYSCPLAPIATVHPELCQLTRAMLTEIIGESVVEQCERDEPARCRFVVARR